jgi:hypothetical protein
MLAPNESASNVCGGGDNNSNNKNKNGILGKRFAG